MSSRMDKAHQYAFFSVLPWLPRPQKIQTRSYFPHYPLIRHKKFVIPLKRDEFSPHALRQHKKILRQLNTLQRIPVSGGRGGGVLYL
jgi:hypothetical protein